MSIILDALRKLERTRPRGKVPYLHTVHEPLGSPPRRPARWIGLAAAALLAAAAVLLVWLAPWKSPPETAPAPEEERRPRLTTSAETPGEVMAPLVAVGSPPPSSRAIGIVARTPTTPAAASTGGSPPEHAWREAEDEVSPAPPEVTAPQASMDLPSGPTTRLPEPVAETGPAPGPPGGGTGEGASATVPKEIGELQFSGHIYSDDAAMRMMILGNRVLKEGDPIDAALRVEEITAAGALISFKGARYTVRISGK